MKITVYLVGKGRGARNGNDGVSFAGEAQEIEREGKSGNPKPHLSNSMNKFSRHNRPPAQRQATGDWLGEGRRDGVDEVRELW